MSDIGAIQAELIEEFSFFDNWMDRYQYIIDLGKKLPDFPEEFQTDEYRLHGCQSQVWLKGGMDGDKFRFQATSDSAIVSGLIALVMRVYDNQPPAAVAATTPDFIAAIGLTEHLSPTRNNGLAAMIKSVREQAQACAG